MDEVYMDIPAVRIVAKNFGAISEVLNMVSKVMEALMLILNTTAFIGMVGGAAVAHYIDMVKPHIDEMAKKCDELMTDLNSSIDAFERGDTLGATKFY